MSGEFVIEQAEAGHDEAGALGCLWGGREQGGGCDWQAAAGGVATRPQLIAKLRNSGSP